jgi:hypothetical protein
MPAIHEDALQIVGAFGITAEAAKEFSIPEPVLDDMADLVPLLPPGFTIPEIEVDEDDGIVVARWFSADMRESFSITFPGLGTITAYHSRAFPDPAWKMALVDKARLMAKLSEASLTSLICPKVSTR